MPVKTKASNVIKESTLPNYLMIKFGYDAELIFPYSKGIAILELLEAFEIYDTSDYSNPIITYAKADKNIVVRIMSGTEYLDLKAKGLLRIKNAIE